MTEQTGETSETPAAADGRTMAPPSSASIEAQDASYADLPRDGEAAKVFHRPVAETEAHVLLFERKRGVPHAL